MSKIIDGTGAILGRLSSYAAKEALKGEEIIILNCNHVIITGNRKDIEKQFQQKRSRVGSSQKGPKHSKSSEKIVKRTIRNMLPEHRFGRGKEIFKKIKCYAGVPKEFQNSKMIKAGKEKPSKFIFVKEVVKRWQ